jgi:hypothetical protein
MYGNNEKKVSFLQSLAGLEKKCLVFKIFMLVWIRCLPGKHADPGGYDPGIILIP